ncbi:MAG: peptidyl-prolyl cis-trans isomerase, partial [Pseudomonadota bacterium]
MFESVRKHQRIFLGLILLLIIPSFVVVGAWDLIAPGADGATVAKVGKAKIQYPQWERAHQQSLDQIRAQLGGRIDPAMLDTPASRLSTLNDLVTQQVLLTAANDLRIRISDERMRRTIASIPAVQKDGKFDMALYERALKAQGLTPEGFEQQVRADLMIDVLPSSIASSTLVPRAVARRLAQVGLETRVVRLK